MAYRSSTRGGSRGSARGGSSRTASSTNMAAYAFAVIALVAVVVVLVVAMGGKDAPPAEKADVGVSTAQPVAPVAKPTEKPAAPFPKVDDALISKAKAFVKTINEPLARAKALYDEGMRAKQSGNDALWQEKLGEAVKPLMDIRDGWNEIVDTLPESKDYTPDEIANHFLGHEANLVTDALKLLATIRKTMHIK